MSTVATWDRLSPPRASASPSHSILVVEDDVTLRELLSYGLRRVGFEVFTEGTAGAGQCRALEPDVDLVLLDVMLPGGDGIGVARSVKEERPDLPVILLTARSEKEVQLAGFRAGADDFVTKPFDMDELLARIRARLGDDSSGNTPGSKLLVGDLELDPSLGVLRSPAAEVHLRPKEQALLSLFFGAPGRLFTREEIVEGVWDQRYLPSSRTLDVQIGRLREKMALLQDGGPTIETFRGVGYRLLEVVTDC